MKRCKATLAWEYDTLCRVKKNYVMANLFIYVFTHLGNTRFPSFVPIREVRRFKDAV